MARSYVFILGTPCGPSVEGSNDTVHEEPLMREMIGNYGSREEEAGPS